MAIWRLLRSIRLGRIQTMNRLSDKSTAYALARIGLGLNIAIHGFIRLPKLEAFAIGLQVQFAQSILPASLVYASGYGIAIAEAIIGTLLVLGFFLRPALIAGTVLMILLITGTCLIENWQSAGLQMVYLAFYALLLAFREHNAWSLDRN